VRRLWRALASSQARSDPLIPALDRTRGEARALVPLQTMTARTIARAVEHVVAALGMGRRFCHPHALRHAYAFAQLNPRLRPDGQPSRSASSRTASATVVSRRRRGTSPPARIPICRSCRDVRARASA
jgi:integrase